jgi:hypothetical protein
MSAMLHNSPFLPIKFIQISAGVLVSISAFLELSRQSGRGLPHSTTLTRDFAVH